jgi:hypothetical protein
MRQSLRPTLKVARIAAPVLALVALTFLTVGAGSVSKPDPRQVDRGKSLVWAIGCNDCHTPKRIGPKGPELDTPRLLSGHREEPTLPPPPVLEPGPWGIVTSMELTAWSGPWGVSYGANLTPDENTGLGIWTEEMFIKTLRTGRHMGASRQILPPMPWEVYGRLPDEDLKAIYAYLRSIPSVKNRVPAPIIIEE